MFYTMTDIDIELVLMIARQRNSKKAEIKSKKIDPNETDLSIHSYGIVGEIAVANVLGCDIDTNRYDSHGDYGYDIIMPNGLTIDVKTRTISYGEYALNGPNIGFMRADIGVLCKIDKKNIRQVELVGWTTKVSIALFGEIKNFGYGDRLVATNLYDMSKLLLARKAPPIYSGE